VEDSDNDDVVVPLSTLLPASSTASITSRWTRYKLTHQRRGVAIQGAYYPLSGKYIIFVMTFFDCTADLVGQLNGNGQKAMLHIDAPTVENFWLRHCTSEPGAESDVSRWKTQTMTTWWCRCRHCCLRQSRPGGRATN